jgi:SAM-dependent methyltransferase
MRQINYQDWADYIWDIRELYSLNPANVLELGGGASYIANCLFNNVEQYIVSDYSYDMLMQDENKFIDKVCCDMKALPFSIKFDYIFSTFDSVNYITDEDSLLKLFNEVSQVISDNGIFTFDVSLEKNSYKNVKRLNRKGKFKGIKYIQRSRYNTGTKIHVNEFKIFVDDKEIIEIHRQKIYPIEKFFELIEECGLFVADCFESFSFDDAGADSERVQFVVKKEV